MTPLEIMAKAMAKEDWGHGRAGGPWSDEVWERLLNSYREIDTQNETDFVKRIYKEAHYLDRIFKQAHAALIALSEADIPEDVMEACAEAYEGAVASAKEKTRAFWASRDQEVPANQRGVAPMEWLQPTLAAMLRAISGETS